MKNEIYSIFRYDADDGYVFDWKIPRFEENENGEMVRQHLYVKTLFIGYTDTIDNYVEVLAPQED